MRRLNLTVAKAAFCALAAFVLILGTLPGRAQTAIDVTTAQVDPIPLAIPPLSAPRNANTSAGSLSDVGKNISNVVTADLERSGLFRAIDPAAFIRLPANAAVRPRFSNWRAISADALVTGQVTQMQDGRLRVEFRLWDVQAENQMTGLALTTTPQNWRRIAHKVSDAIYRRMTGESGYFDTRLVYIAESGPKTNRTKRLALMDQDGYNHRYLTSGADLVLTPRFSPNRQEITYLAYYNDQPRVWLYNIDSQKHEVLGDFPNMTFAPRFSPDGNRVIMSLADGGNSDVYVMDLRTRRTRRLTNDPGIDTSPSYSPEGDEIVFNSDRGGSQQLYVMSDTGARQRRISFGSGRYGTPVWSPRGDLIAFTKIGEGKFRIGVMKPDGSGERILTDSYQDEAPTWSPNGRVLIFFRTRQYDRSGRGGDTSLWSVDLTGYNERPVPTPLDASDPAWSPLQR